MLHKQNTEPNQKFLLKNFLIKKLYIIRNLLPGKPYKLIPTKYKQNILSKLILFRFGRILRIHKAMGIHKAPLRKIPGIHLVSCCKNFGEMHSFRRVSSQNSAETITFLNVMQRTFKNFSTWQYRVPWQYLYSYETNSRKIIFQANKRHNGKT